MTREAKQVKFGVGDRVTNLSGERKGTITRMGSLGDCAQVQWDNSPQELTEITDLKKE